MVVEFFRGKGSETRFFPNNNRNKQKLFGNSKLSVKRIRALGGEAHYYVVCWQWDCEKWLRGRKIIPNKGTQYFIGLPQNLGRFDFNNGLPKPSQNKQQERKYQLNDWRNTISRLEEEANRYCQ